MKKTYFATCVPGGEGVVEMLLRHESGVAVEWAGEAGVLFRSEREPNLPYLHNLYLVLHTFSGLPDLDAAIKKLLLSGEWLDRMPFASLEGKRFRIVTMQGQQLVPVDMKYLHLLEQVIVEHTGMRSLRERPDVELWLIRTGKGATLFTWRLKQRKGKEQGSEALRGDVCAILAAQAKVGGKDTTCIGFRDQGMVQALRQAGATGIQTLADATALEGVPDDSVRSLVIRFAEGAANAPSESGLRSTLLSIGRVLHPQGSALLVAAEGRLDHALSQQQAIEIQNHLALRIGGKELTAWSVVPMTSEA